MATRDPKPEVQETSRRPVPDSLAVWLDDPAFGPLARIGSLHHTDKGGVRFEYEQDWLAHPNVFKLDPRLSLDAGSFYPVSSTGANFGVFLDSCPDRWGQLLMQRRETVAAKMEARKPRQLRAWDFLLGVQDITRMGALRFSDASDIPSGQPVDLGQVIFRASEAIAAPPVTALATLQQVAFNLSRKDHDDLDQLSEWLKVLVAPGSSLGGARPKANVVDREGTLWIAKFPAADDDVDVALREKLVHDMARDCGIDVPQSLLEQFGSGHHTFRVPRFDRKDGRRRFFTSAMTLLEKSERENSSYLELAEFLSHHGCPGQIESDLRELFRRILFNVIVANRDDHLRNHGFIRELQGWRLAPAYDMNPSARKDEHAIALDDGDHSPSVANALATARFYRLKDTDAQGIHAQIADVVGTWDKRARKLGMSAADRADLEGLFQL